MGITYKALDMQTGGTVAVKQLLFSRMQEWKPLEMFEREAKTLQQLTHPRIPKYIDYFTLESAAEYECILIQECIEGVTLQERIEKGWRGTEAEILDIFLQLVDILAYLHALQPPMIHRDINPKNIILSENNEVFLVDFGAVHEIIRTTFFGGSTIVGTFGYIPFEQFAGAAVPASDFYAAGATLLYMLTHSQPSDFPVENLQIKLPSDANISVNVRRLLEGLLAPSLETRISSKDEVKEILEARVRAERIQTQVSNLKKKVSRDGKTATFFIIAKRSKEMRFVLGLSSAILFFFALTLLTLTWDQAVALPHIILGTIAGEKISYLGNDESGIFSNFIAWYILPLSIVPMTGIAIRLLLRSLLKSYVQTEIVLSPTRLRVIEKTFGGMTRTVRLAEIDAVRVSSLAQKTQQQEPVIELRAGKKRAKINASALTAVERNSLVEEISSAVRSHQKHGGKECFQMRHAVWIASILLAIIVSGGIIFNGRRNHPPQILSTPPSLNAPNAIDPKEGYIYQIKVFDKENELVKFELLNAPAGMAMEFQTAKVVKNVRFNTAMVHQFARITWKPIVGTHEVEIRVMDERGASATQKFSLEVKPEQFKTYAPKVTLAVQPAVAATGKTVKIVAVAQSPFFIATTTAEVRQVRQLSAHAETAFQLSAFNYQEASGVMFEQHCDAWTNMMDGEYAGTAYTPDVPGEYVVRVTVTDSIGNQTQAEQLLTVRAFDLSSYLGEGVDIETGQVERDLEVFIFGPTDDMTQGESLIETENMFDFSDAADFYFGYQNYLPMFTPQPSVSTFLMKDTLYETVDKKRLKTIQLRDKAGREPMTPNDTMIFKTAEGRIYKLGNVYKNVFDASFSFDYQQLVP